MVSQLIGLFFQVTVTDSLVAIRQREASGVAAAWAATIATHDPANRFAHPANGRCMQIRHAGQTVCFDKFPVNSTERWNGHGIIVLEHPSGPILPTD